MILTVGAPYVGPLTFACHDDHIARVMQRTHMVYEADLLGYMARSIPHEGIWIDIGACIGTHSVYFGKLGVSVFAYEPVPENFVLLAQNVKQVSEGVIHYAQCGFGAEHRRASIIYHPENMGMCRLFSIPGMLDADVEVRPVDSLFPEIGFLTGGAPLTLIKIDTEGCELEVLQGAQETLKQWHPHLFIEAIGPQVQAVDAFLAPLGYQRQPGQWGYTPVYHWSAPTSLSR